MATPKPFLQYTYARIRSVIRKAGGVEMDSMPQAVPNEKESTLIQKVADFPLWWLKLTAPTPRLLLPTIATTLLRNTTSSITTTPSFVRKMPK